MAEENQVNENGDFSLAETDEVLDQFLELESIDGGIQGEPIPLGIEMSAQQLAEIAAAEEAAKAGGEEGTGEGTGDGDDPDASGNTDNETPPDLITQLLQAKGIKDGLVKIEDEAGNIEDVKFTDLTPEEQLNILSSSDEPELNEQEQTTINFLRENGVTFDEAVDYFVKKAVAEATAETTAEKSISDFTDDEIYAFDLQAKYKDFTPEEIEIELTKQREHPELFKKKVDALRNEYLQLEKDQLTQKEQDVIEKENAEFKAIAESLVGVAKEVESYGGLDIEIADKQEVLGFILNKDVNGVTEFGKLLDDPKALFEVAWYAKKGKEAFDTIHDYYREEISKATKNAYEKGKAEAKPKTTAPANNLKTVVKNKTSNTNLPPQNNYPSIDSLYEDVITNKQK